MFKQLESQHYYSRELISNAIMNRLQLLFLMNFIIAACSLGAVLCCMSCVYLSASLLGSSAFDLDNRLKSDDCNTST